MRTLTLICVASTLLSLLSAYMATEEIHLLPQRGDPTRIASGVISGIGFLGGGVIIKQGLNVKGLTSASIIYSTAAIGLALGAGLYIQTALVMIINILLLLFIEKIEFRFFPSLKYVPKAIVVRYNKDSTDCKKILDALSDAGLTIEDYNVVFDAENNELEFEAFIRVPRLNDFSELSEKLEAAGTLKELRIDS